MSVYAQLEGTIRYLDKKSFCNAKTILVEAGWVNENRWQDEAGGAVADDIPAFDEKEMIITIPRSYYRNLLHVSSQLINFAHADVKWVSTDGMFDGGYLGAESVDLNKWAKENGLEPEPKESEFENDDDYYQAQSDWQEYVCDAFMDIE